MQSCGHSIYLICTNQFLVNYAVYTASITSAFTVRSRQLVEVRPYIEERCTHCTLLDLGDCRSHLFIFILKKISLAEALREMFFLWKN